MASDHEITPLNGPVKLNDSRMKKDCFRVYDFRMFTLSVKGRIKMQASPVETDRA